MVECPLCRGQNSGLMMSARRQGDDLIAEFAIGECPVCEGVGEVSEDHAARFAVGRAVVEFREAHKIKARRFATLAGISPVELGAIESGREPMTAQGKRIVEQTVAYLAKRRESA